MSRVLQASVEWAKRCVAAWTGEIPPHSYALLRILLGAVALTSLIGLTPVEMYWPLDGLNPVPLGGPRAWIAAHGWGTAAGWAFYFALLVAFTAMMLGLFSDAAVLASFVGLLTQTHWNNIPLSSAHQIVAVLIFGLIWTDSGRVWSLDARWRTPRTSARRGNVAAWPLMIMRFQIALVYGSSALYKLASPVWRDGSAVHWAINLNDFHRLPWTIPEAAAPLVALMTWGTLLFEFAFPVMVIFKRTRTPILLAGIGLHLSLWLTMELGPFSWVMIASYIAFVDPFRVPNLFSKQTKPPEETVLAS